MIVLCGKTCSGKNYIRDLLLKEGLEPVVTYTTRPMRKGEVNGKTYHFISAEDFKQKRQDNLFVEATSYNVASGEEWFYGSHFNKNDNNKVIILNPHGVDALLKTKIKDVNPVIFYLDVPEEILRKRLEFRGDNPVEAERRLKADAIDFQGIENKANFCLKNTNEVPTEKLVKEIIDLHAKSINPKLSWKASSKEITRKEQEMDR